MKRAGRWLFNLAASLSLALFAVVCALWARSYVVCDRVEVGLNGPGELPLAPPALLAEQNWPQGRPWYWRHYATIESARGGILAANLSVVVINSRENPGVLWVEAGGSLFRDLQTERFGFGWEIGSTRWWGKLGSAIVFPCWFLALAALVLPAVRLRRWIAKLRAPKPGFCSVCGYDLRATLDRCPECGAAPAAAAAEAIVAGDVKARVPRIPLH
jgi:hypothetical protein